MRKSLLGLTCGLLAFIMSAGVMSIRRDLKPPLSFGPPEDSSASLPVYRCDETPDLPLPIEVLLNRNFQGWDFPAITEDDCYAVRECGGPKAFPQLIKGDFNDDGRMDYAVLIQQGPEANDKGVARPWMIHVVAFLRTGNGYKMYPVTSEGGGSVMLMPKGKSDYDYENQRDFTYPRDAILSGWTSYLYEYGKFRPINTVD